VNERKNVLQGDSWKGLSEYIQYLCGGKKKGSTSQGMWGHQGYWARGEGGKKGEKYNFFFVVNTFRGAGATLTGTTASPQREKINEK